MTIRKLGPLPQWMTCTNADHELPRILPIEPGFYEHKCQACGRTTTFTVMPTKGKKS